MKEGTTKAEGKRADDDDAEALKFVFDLCLSASPCKLGGLANRGDEWKGFGAVQNQTVVLTSKKAKKLFMRDIKNIKGPLTAKVEAQLGVRHRPWTPLWW